MTASEFAKIVGAKRVKTGAWLAHCPAHPDRHSSLSIKSGDKCVLVYCQSAHCTLEEICSSIGIKKRELFYSDRISPVVRLRLDQETALAALERLKALLLWLEALNPTSRYYQKAVRGITLDYERMRLKMYPAREVERVHQALVHRSINKFGFGTMWEQYLASPKGKADTLKYGLPETA